MSDHFHGWLEQAKQQERDRLKAGSQQETFSGFGHGDEEDEDAWSQWMDFVTWLAEGSPGDSDKAEFKD